MDTKSEHHLLNKANFLFSQKNNILNILKIIFLFWSLLTLQWNFFFQNSSRLKEWGKRTNLRQSDRRKNKYAKKHMPDLCLCYDFCHRRHHLHNKAAAGRHRRRNKVAGSMVAGNMVADSMAVVLRRSLRRSHCHRNRHYSCQQTDALSEFWRCWRIKKKYTRKRVGWVLRTLLITNNQRFFSKPFQIINFL